MSIIKSFSVGNGDMFYIQHNSSNFTMIDCCLNDSTSQTIIDELLRAKRNKQITRFISTHPDDDHIHGLSSLNAKIPLMNFYCVKNSIVKENPSDDFSFYCSLRDGNIYSESPKTIHLTRGLHLKWLNDCNKDDKDDPRPAGINCLWPDPENAEFQKALRTSEGDVDVNNIAPIFTYSLRDGVRTMWMGDMETPFQETIMADIDWPRIDVLFAPHHGRKSGRVPASILEKIQPTIIIIGEAPSEQLYYYPEHMTITQNLAKDVVLHCERRTVHVYVGNKNYSPSDSVLTKTLISPSMEFGHYIGSFKTKAP